MSRRAFIEGPNPLIGKADAIGFGGPDLRVEMIDKERADEIIRRNHYSGSAVWSSSFHFGVFQSDALIGVLQFGPAMNPASGAKIVAGTKTDQWLELNRMWLSDDKPDNAASQAIAFAVRVVRRRRPTVAWIQSFADERCGKLGAVYQAAGFLYCGSHLSTFYRAGGEWFHKSLLGRAAVDSRGWGSGPKAARFRELRDEAEAFTYRQFRYIKILRPWARRALLLPILPYPKPVPTEAVA